jgi:hypothetical protein
VLVAVRSFASVASARLLKSSFIARNLFPVVVIAVTLDDGWTFWTVRRQW